MAHTLNTRLDDVDDWRLKGKIVAEINLTTACQLDCPYCYMRARNSGKSIRELSWHCFAKCVKMITGLVTPDASIRWEFSGGEPTIHDGLPRMARYLESLRICDYVRAGDKLSLVTNGLRCTDRAFCELLVESGIESIRLTFLSSRANIHDSITGIPESHARAVVALHNLLRLAERKDIELGVHIVLTAANASSLVETVEFLVYQGVRAISVNRSMTIATDSCGEQVLDLPMQCYVTAFLEARAIAMRAGATLINTHKVPLCQLPDGAPRKVFSHPCGIGNRLLVVEPDGRILGCDFCPVPVGKIYRGARDEIKSLGKALLKLHTVTFKWVHELCDECELFDLCGGMCPAQVSIPNAICH
ncbi:MAG: Coenzyme PQQ synthesis protein E [bacterium]|nr:Coenzyme PQQ synthesis protein E [bacterium]